MRIAISLLAVLPLAWAHAGEGTLYVGSKPAWQAPAGEPIRAPAEFEDQRRQEIEDLIRKEKLTEIGYRYDHFGIWEDRQSFWDHWRVDVQLQAWYPTLKGPITLGDQGKYDLVEFFGLQAPRAAPLARVELWYDSVFLQLESYGIGFSGSKRIDTEIQLPDGTIVRINEQLNTRLDITQVRIAFGGTIAKSRRDERDERDERNERNEHEDRRDAMLRTNQWSFDIFGGLNVFNFELEFDLANRPGSVLARAWLPVPVIGLRFGGNVKRFLYEIEVSGLGLSVEIFGAEYIDLRASVGYQFGRQFAIRAGYRYTDMGAWVTSVRLDFVLAGPFLEAVFAF